MSKADDSATSIAPQEVRFHAHDGYPLAARRYDPAQAAKGVVVIAPAMAVAQAFYQRFASYLASQGLRVWTFDYRGIGASLNGSMRAVETDLTTWITLDYDAALMLAAQTDPHLPLFVIGHSFGGQVAPLLPSRQHIAGLITIAAGSGAMRHNTPATRRRAPLLWYLLIPLLCPVFGYFPGDKVGVIGDVPSGAIRQWRKWCLTPDYLLTGEPGARAAYASAAYPVLALAFSDDELLLEQGIRLLHSAYSRPPEFRLLHAKDFDLSRIGHFGFFKPQAATRLWPKITQWLEQQIVQQFAATK